MSAGNRMNPASPRQKLTYDDLLLYPEDEGRRHELIDGEHYVTASPNLRHQAISKNIFLALSAWLDAHPIGSVWYAPLDIVFTNVDVVVPDLLYMSNERAGAVATAKNIQGAPELLVEIGSRSTRTRDESLKRRLYERFGVDEYWIVDPDTDVVRVYRRQQQEFARVSELSRDAGDVLTTPLLPGLELPLSRIFQE